MHLPSDSTKLQSRGKRGFESSGTLTAALLRHVQRLKGVGGLSDASPSVYEVDDVRHADSSVQRRVRRAGGMLSPKPLRRLPATTTTTKNPYGKLTGRLNG